MNETGDFDLRCFSEGDLGDSEESSFEVTSNEGPPPAENSSFDAFEASMIENGKGRVFGER